MKVIGVMRRLIGANGSIILQPLGFFATNELADEFIAHQKGFLAELANFHVVEMTREGPKGVMPVPQLFAELGIASVDLVRLTSEVKESNLVVPRTPPVILQ